MIKYMEFCLMYLIYGKNILPLFLQSKHSNTLIIKKEPDEYIWQNINDFHVIPIFTEKKTVSL